MLAVGLVVAGTAKAEAPVAAAAKGVGLETAPASAPGEPSGAAPPPAEATAATPEPVEAAAPPPSPPPPSPPQEIPQPQEIAEEAAAAVESAAASSLPRQPEPEVVGAAQEELADVADRAVGSSEAVLSATADTARSATTGPIGLTRQARAAVSATLGPVEDALPRIDQTLAKPLAASPVKSEGRPPVAPPLTGAAMSPHPSLAFATTLFSPTPIGSSAGDPAPPPGQGEPERSTLNVGNGLPRLTDSTGFPEPFGNLVPAGASTPSPPSPPSPSLPDTFDAVATTAGGIGSGLLLALLALAGLLAPTFASKLRMHAGNCRPAPFVSLLERPG